jgi:Amt family ammonium transporter
MLRDGAYFYLCDPLWCFFLATEFSSQMDNINSAVETLIHGSNTLFILLGAVMVLAMHAGFAFLEVGTVRQKNQVNALSKIISDFAVSALAYFFVGYWIA